MPFNLFQCNIYRAVLPCFLLRIYLCSKKLVKQKVYKYKISQNRNQVKYNKIEHYKKHFNNFILKIKFILFCFDQIKILICLLKYIQIFFIYI